MTVSCFPWVTFRDWRESRYFLFATWILIIRSDSNLSVSQIVMVLQHLIFQLCLAITNLSNRKKISLKIVWTCYLLMSQEWWILWLILLLIILTIFLFYSLWRWVLKFLIFNFLVSHACSCVANDPFNHNWSAIYNKTNPVSEFNIVTNSLIDRRVPSKIIRLKVNYKALFNKDCVTAFHNRQNAYCLWSQNSAHFLWEEYVVHRRHVQSGCDAALLEYNYSIRESL